jgi:hypothetical protein
MTATSQNEALQRSHLVQGLKNLRGIPTIFLPAVNVFRRPIRSSGIDQPLIYHISSATREAGLNPVNNNGGA